MKARINGWRPVEVDVVRDLASNPHRVEMVIDGYGKHLTLDLSAAEADSIGSALVSAADADDCARCGMPCDPGEAYCPTCEDER